MKQGDIEKEQERITSWWNEEIIEKKAYKLLLRNMSENTGKEYKRTSYDVKLSVKR